MLEPSLSQQSESGAHAQGRTACLPHQHVQRSTDTENRLAATKGGRERGRTNQELEASGYKPQYTKQTDREVLLQGPGSYSQRLAMNLDGEE